MALCVHRSLVDVCPGGLRSWPQGRRAAGLQGLGLASPQICGCRGIYWCWRCGARPQGPQGGAPAKEPRVVVPACVCPQGKPDLNTALPVRQTASIFKQPVTKITNHPSNKVKSDPQKAVEQPRQVSPRDPGPSSGRHVPALLCFVGTGSLRALVRVPKCPCVAGESLRQEPGPWEALVAACTVYTALGGIWIVAC